MRQSSGYVITLVVAVFLTATAMLGNSTPEIVHASPQEPVKTTKAGPQDFALAQTMTLSASSSGAQASYKLGEKIIVSYDGPIPEGGKLSILWDPDATLDTEQSGNRMFIWSTTPGDKTCDATIIPLKSITVEGQTFDVLAGPPIRYKVRFTIEGKAPPKPDEDDDPPKPQPPGPKPSKEIARIVVVMDTNTDTQPENQKILELRSGPWSEKLLVLDKSQITPQLQQYRVDGGAEEFPQFFAVSSDGEIIRRGHIDDLKLED